VAERAVMASGTAALGTFAIVGAQKGGTTALSSFLAAHPDICMAEPRETHFFDRSCYFGTGVPPYAAYERAVYPHYQGEAAVGWSTPSIMFVPDGIERLARYNPALRLIALLRHPAERAFSHYRMQVTSGLEQLAFPAALDREAERLAAGTDFGEPGILYSYASRGLYGPQIRRLLHVFGRDQVLFLTAQALRDQHRKTLAAAYHFLKVPLPEVFPPERLLHVGQRSSMQGSERAALVRFYQRTAAEVEELLGWDLAAWRI
jgi:Sulfotransferase domain